jgi:preprotein translocase subunit SecG
MTEDSAASNQDKIEQVTTEIVAKKRQTFLTKIVVILALIFFGYLGFKYFQASNKKTEAKKEVEKYSNIDGEIFDLSGDHEAQKSDSDHHGLDDMTITELKEKGAEFIYQMLLKNQLQINDLKEQIQTLQSEFLKYKNREKIAKIILVYVDLRQEIFAAKPHDFSLKNFEMLTISDEILQSKIANLKSLLPTFVAQEKLQKSFANLIPELIVTKNNKPDSGLVAKIRRNVSKLIIIRKIGEKDNGDVDSKISRTEKFLREENYQEALNSLLSLDQNYHEIIKDFLDELTIAIEVQKIDQEILNYLKNLT